MVTETKTKPQIHMDEKIVKDPELEHMLECCKGGKVSSCRIVGTLADYSHRNCVHDSH